MLFRGHIKPFSFFFTTLTNILGLLVIVLVPSTWIASMRGSRDKCCTCILWPLIFNYVSIFIYVHCYCPIDLHVWNVFVIAPNASFFLLKNGTKFPKSSMFYHSLSLFSLRPSYWEYNLFYFLYYFSVLVWFVGKQQLILKWGILASRFLMCLYSCLYNSWNCPVPIHFTHFSWICCVVDQSMPPKLISATSNGCKFPYFKNSLFAFAFPCKTRTIMEIYLISCFCCRLWRIIFWCHSGCGVCAREFKFRPDNAIEFQI